MTDPGVSAAERLWADAGLAAALFAIDPHGLGGVRLRGGPGAARDAWLAALRAWLPAGSPLRRLPANITDERLLGGLDLTATLQAGRPVVQRGLLAECDGGVVLAAMAERLPGSTAAKLCAVLDRGEVVAARDGISLREPAAIGVVLLDEGLTAEEVPPPALCDRLAFELDLTAVRIAHDFNPLDQWAMSVNDVVAARRLLATVTIDDASVQAICGTALALGVPSMRAAQLAVRAARVLAALDGRSAVDEDDASAAARLVLGPRATQVPAEPPPEDEPPPEEEQPPEPPEPPETPEDEPPPQEEIGELEDRVLEATLAALPPGLLLALQSGLAKRGGAQSAGRRGAEQGAALRGRPAGVRRGLPRGGARLDLIATLRTAAPWQRLRHLERQRAQPGVPARLEVRADDCHVKRFKERAATTTVFVVDASGSAALNRLAEAKGAVESLLAECYIRRDQVAVVAFRGRAAEVLLPPTRSLVRAKRSLAGLPGGGGTPLAAGLEAARLVVEGALRRGESPLLVLLTDGRANIARDGSPGRERAEEEALTVARQVRLLGVKALVIDTSPRPQPQGARLAIEMAARYLPLPYADAGGLVQAVRAAG